MISCQCNMSELLFDRMEKQLCAIPSRLSASAGGRVMSGAGRGVQLRILTEEGGNDEAGAEDQFDDLFLKRIEGSMLSQVALQVCALPRPPARPPPAPAAACAAPAPSLRFSAWHTNKSQLNQ